MKDNVGWNRSSENSPIVGKQRNAGLSTVFKGAIAGAVIVCGFALAWFLLSDGSDRVLTPSEDGQRGKIKAVTPAAAPKAVEEVKKPMTEAERIFAETNGMSLGALRQWEFKNWKGKVYTSGVHRVKSLEEKVFANGAERMIAGLLRIEPGTPMIGDSKAYFNKRFLEYFKKSLVEPTLVQKDDSDEVKALKRAVNETKAELKARMDKGEDICQILADTRDEMKSLGLYRQELEKTVKEQIKDGNMSDEDAKICIDAANKMLADRGAKPLKMPAIYMKMLKLKNAKKNQEEVK